MKNIMKTKLCLTAILFAVPLIARAQTADEIVSKAIAARGGVEKIQAVKAQRISGTISFGPGATGPFLVELKRPNKMHMEITILNQTLVRSYDGQSSGWIVNPFAEKKDAEPMSAEDLKSITDESDFDGPLVDYKAKGNKIELVGKEDLDGKSVYRLKLTNKYGESRSYLFDASSFLLLKWEGTRKMEDKEFPIETFFRDYREVHGLKFAFEIDSNSSAIRQQQNITIDKIEIDAQIDDARFGKPVPPAAPAEPTAPVPPGAR